MFLLFCNTIGQPIRDQFGGVWSVALGKWLCSPVGNDGKLDGRLECKNDDVTIGPLSSKSKIKVYHMIIRNSFLEFFSHLPEKLEETGVYGFAPPGGVPPFAPPTGAPTVPGPGF